MHIGYGLDWSCCTLGLQLDWTDGFLLASGLGPLSIAVYFGEEPPY